MSAADWKPPWLAFARSRGIGPDSSGLKTWEFMAWIPQQWEAWERETGRRHSMGRSAEDHADFDAWLNARHP